MEATTKDLQTFTTTEVEEEQTVRSKVRIYRFTGRENHLQSLVEASILTRTYRESEDRGSIKGGFFARSIFEKILSQKGCLGIRNYFARMNDGTRTLVLVGADEKGNDMSNGWLGADMLPLVSGNNLLNSDLGDHFVQVSKDDATLTGEENHSITIAEAKNFVQNYRKDNDENTMKGGYFSGDIYERILDQEGCVGITCYFASKPNGTPTIVLVGVNSKGDDMVSGIIGQNIIPCPPYCSPDSAL